MKQEQAKKKRKIFKTIIFIFSFLFLYNNVYATATPSIDMTASSLPLSEYLINNPPSFENRRSNDDTELWFAPLKVSNTITGVNSIKMKFIETSTGRFVCPDTGDNGRWSQKWAGLELHKIAESSTPYDEVYDIMGVNPPDIMPFDLSSNSIKIYNVAFGGSTSLPSSYNAWRKNADGSCSMYITDDGENLSTQLDSGWYILRMYDTNMDSSTTQNYETMRDWENADTQKISILGDNSFDTAVIAEYINGNNWALFPNSQLNNYAPFKPSMPYMEFTFTAPPVIEKESSCNPFSGDITTAFLNTEFSLSGCLKGIASTLFIPSSGISSKFSVLMDEIKTKPPFGWVSGVFEFLSFDSTALDGYENAFDLEQLTPITTTIFDPIRIGLSWVIYFVFALYLFNRFKDIHI